MLQRNFFSRLNQWIVFSLLTLVVFAIVAAGVTLVEYLRKEEVKRINLQTKVIRIQQEIASPDPAVLELLPDISNANSTIPFVVLDKDGNLLEFRNIKDEIKDDTLKILNYAKTMEKHYPAIELKFPNGNNQFVYYDNSPILNKLQYSPYLLGLFILAYLVFSFWFVRTVKKTDEGFLWAGLAKETAHQIGTPLSSMIGWIEILRMENENSEGVAEIEKDIKRLKTISERFSKIGSVPELNDLNLNETVQQNYDYLKTRISKKVNFKLMMPNQEILIPHNRILLSWVIENLVKNVVDAMKGSGKLDISLYEKNKNIIIDFKDTGSGMSVRNAAKAFKPGFSTKKRGWGLGLSLAKRVIKEYHNGDIKIAQTEIGKGSTFRIILKSD